MPTTGGVVWFKAARPAFAHEARVLEVLRPLAPDLLPELIASTQEGWLLLADAGERAREHPIDWRRLLAEYARLQGAAAGHVDWGDSAVAHPFFTLSVAEPEELGWVVEAWEGYAPRAELEEEAAIVDELRFLLRALNWEHTAGLGESEHLIDRIRLFVGG